MFPLIVTHQKKFNLQPGISPERIINLIKQELTRLKVDIIEPNEEGLNFKNSFMNGQGRSHLMSPVDKGSFEINWNSKEINYTYSVWRTFHIATGFSFFLGLIAYSSPFFPWHFFFFFFWLFGANWIINFFRQKKFLNKLIRQISELN